jgi:hypothetical protein
MIGKSRLSISTIMVVISVAAADCAIFREDNSGFALVLPMANLLGFGVWRWKRRRSAQPFWVGFEVVGWASLGLVLLWQWYDRNFSDTTVFYRPIIWLEQHKWISEDGPVQLVIAYCVMFGFYNLPQLPAAMLGGFLSARYRVVRRTPPFGE